MNNTYQILINWDKGQAFAERMVGKIIGIEGYQEIDPQSPVGGPDGTKDIICNKEGVKFIAGCFFPNGQKEFNEIQEKFERDILGVEKNIAQGFIFITNQKITPNQRFTLCQNRTFKTVIMHGEYVCGILDSPKGYGVRLEYLGIELNKAEQISFLSSHLDLKQNFDEIKDALDKLNKVTSILAGQSYSRDFGSSKLSTLPIAGVKFSSRLSIEDLLVLHKIILMETQGLEYHSLLGFRKLDVWIGSPGLDIENADFVPIPPADVPSKTCELLNWWRGEYMNITYSSNDKKITAISIFHERFLSIHPFLDGNGRIARVLASIQFKDLLDKDVTFEKIERNEYYKALQTARQGNGQNLNDIFIALIKE